MTDTPMPCRACGGDRKAGAYCGPHGHSAKVAGVVVSAADLCYECWLDWWELTRHRGFFGRQSCRSLARLAGVSRMTAHRAKRRLGHKEKPEEKIDARGII